MKLTTSIITPTYLGNIFSVHYTTPGFQTHNWIFKQQLQFSLYFPYQVLYFQTQLSKTYNFAKSCSSLTYNFAKSCFPLTYNFAKSCSLFLRRILNNLYLILLNHTHLPTILVLSQSIKLFTPDPLTTSIHIRYFIRSIMDGISQG